jgi:hypothetical protein
LGLHAQCGAHRPRANEQRFNWLSVGIVLCWCLKPFCRSCCRARGRTPLGTPAIASSRVAARPSAMRFRCVSLRNQRQRTCASCPAKRPPAPASAAPPPARRLPRARQKRRSSNAPFHPHRDIVHLACLNFCGENYSLPGSRTVDRQPPSFPTRGFAMGDEGHIQGTIQ